MRSLYRRLGLLLLLMFSFCRTRNELTFITLYLLKLVFTKYILISTLSYFSVEQYP